MHALQASHYHSSAKKRILDIIVSILAILLSLPIILFCIIIIKLENKGPIFFVQKRVGRKGRVFNLFKFRTMKVGSEEEQHKYKHLNEADGPVFKIYNDPRYTKFGKYLAKTGLDELPQLINVLFGSMSVVGPRPLPTYEAKRLSDLQKIREEIKPGITSTWIVEGAHLLKFQDWMVLDRKYVQEANLTSDIAILLKTAGNIVKSTTKQIKACFTEKKN